MCCCKPTHNIPPRIRRVSRFLQRWRGTLLPRISQQGPSRVSTRMTPKPFKTADEDLTVLIRPVPALHRPVNPSQTGPLPTGGPGRGRAGEDERMRGFGTGAAKPLAAPPGAVGSAGRMVDRRNGEPRRASQASANRNDKDQPACLIIQAIQITNISVDCCKGALPGSCRSSEDHGQGWHPSPLPCPIKRREIMPSHRVCSIARVGEEVCRECSQPSERCYRCAESEGVDRGRQGSERKV